jgi:hypothetical protein
MSPYPSRLTSEMFERFGEFVQSPRRDSYLAVRSALISSDGYDPYSDDLYHAEELVVQKAFTAARDKLLESMPNLLLSPRAHHLLAIIAEETGDKQSSLMEGLIASACAKGIMATGAGSKTNPYLAVRTEDEYDIWFCPPTLEHQNLVLLAPAFYTFRRLRRTGLPLWSARDNRRRTGSTRCECRDISWWILTKAGSALFRVW